MSVATRDQLKQYALRNLGAPVLEINVDDTQLEDRLDEALDYFNLYHYEGVEQMYLKHKINASVLTVTDSAGIPPIGSKLTNNPKFETSKLNTFYVSNEEKNKSA